MSSAAWSRTAIGRRRNCWVCRRVSSMPVGLSAKKLPKPWLRSPPSGGNGHRPVHNRDRGPDRRHGREAGGLGLDRICEWTRDCGGRASVRRLTRAYQGACITSGTGNGPEKTQRSVIHGSGYEHPSPWSVSSSPYRPPASILPRLSEIREILRGSRADVKWEPTEKLHCTIKFLGDTPEELVRRIVDALSEIGSATQPFSVAYKGIGCFPGRRDPRIIWAGMADPEGGLKTLFRGRR